LKKKIQIQLCHVTVVDVFGSTVARVSGLVVTKKYALKKGKAHMVRAMTNPMNQILRFRKV